MKAGVFQSNSHYRGRVRRRSALEFWQCVSKQFSFAEVETSNGAAQISLTPAFRPVDHAPQHAVSRFNGFLRRANAARDGR